LTDHYGWRITCVATNTSKSAGWRLADLEVRHRQRARSEDRIRCLKDTGLRNLPFHGYAQNRIWVELVALTADLLAWTQTLASNEHQPAQRWEPKRLRFRILAVAGRIIRIGRRRLRLARDWPWNHLIDTGLARTAHHLSTQSRACEQDPENRRHQHRRLTSRDQPPARSPVTRKSRHMKRRG